MSFRTTTHHIISRRVIIVPWSWIHTSGTRVIMMNITTMCPAVIPIRELELLLDTWL